MKQVGIRESSIVKAIYYENREIESENPYAIVTKIVTQIELS